MNSKYLQILELPKILERLAEHTSFSAGRKLALSLQPSSDDDEVARRQGETSEARALLDDRADVSLGGARDVRSLVDRAEHGAILLPDELLDVRDTLVSGRSLRRSITRLQASAKQFPLLASAAGRIEECPTVIAEISRCINDRAEVVDRRDLPLHQRPGRSGGRGESESGPRPPRAEASPPEAHGQAG